MLPADQLDRLPVAELDAGTLAFRRDLAALTDAGGKSVGVFVPLAHFARYREVLKADDYPEGVLEPVPLDGNGLPIGITGDELVSQLTKLGERVTAERDAAAGS